MAAQESTDIRLAAESVVRQVSLVRDWVYSLADADTMPCGDAAIAAGEVLQDAVKLLQRVQQGA